MEIGIDAEKDTLQSLIRSCLLELNKLKYDLTALEVERVNDNTPQRIKELEKDIVEKEKEVIVEVEKEPTYTHNITHAEREMLARLVYREANIESLECQMAVVSVVINRWQDGRWGI